MAIFLLWVCYLYIWGSFFSHSNPILHFYKQKIISFTRILWGKSHYITTKTAYFYLWYAGKMHKMVNKWLVEKKNIPWFIERRVIFLTCACVCFSFFLVKRNFLGNIRILQDYPPWRRDIRINIDKFLTT